MALRRSLGEGMTPVDAAPAAMLAALGGSLEPEAGLWLKREDANPTGSHKDRAAAFQLALAAADARPGVVISSSGNAGIATSTYAGLHGLTAVVCVHPETDPAKLAAIDGPTTLLVVTPRAINSAKLISRELGLPNLRPSVNDDALAGYGTLGHELAEAARELEVTDVVLFATSGATAQAVAEQLSGSSGVRVHFVQGQGNASLADPDVPTTDDGAHAAVAGRLGVRHSRRGRRLRAAIDATGGHGHVATAVQVQQGRAALRAAGMPDWEESGANLSIAIGLARLGNRVACVVSGAPVRRASEILASARAAGIDVAGGASLRRIDAVDEHDALVQVRGALASAGGAA